MAGDEILKFLSENLKTKIAILNSVLNNDDSKTHLSSRVDHPDWFRGLDTTYSSKVSLCNECKKWKKKNERV